MIFGGKTDIQVFLVMGEIFLSYLPVNGTVILEKALPPFKRFNFCTPPKEKKKKKKNCLLEDAGT